MNTQLERFIILSQTSTLTKKMNVFLKWNLAASEIALDFYETELFSDVYSEVVVEGFQMGSYFTEINSRVTLLGNAAEGTTNRKS